jgi:hypothetical protein
MMALAGVAPAKAQDYRGAWGIYGGEIFFTNLNAGDLKGPFIMNPNGTPFVGGADLTMQTGWLVGSSLEFWPFRTKTSFLNRFGIRANGGYTQQALSTTFKDQASAFAFNRLSVNDGVLSNDINTWLLNGDIMFRIMKPGRSRVWAPYLAAGAGVVIYAPAGDNTVLIRPANAFIGPTPFVLTDTLGNRTVLPDTGGNNQSKFANVFALGADILPGKWHIGGWGLGLRLEGADHIAWRSPADPITAPGDHFSAVHNFTATAGINALIGRPRPHKVAVAPPPPPAPPPPAAEAITVCVVNPSTDQLETVSAMYMPASRDTMVTVNGQRVNFDQAFPNRAPLYAANADWFVAGRPLELTVDGTRSEWVSFGGPRSIEPSDLALLGTLNGTPIYVAADEAARLRTDLSGLQRATSSRDLAQIARERADVARDIASIDVVYVPLQPGCVFQPFKRTEEVRKVRG